MDLREQIFALKSKMKKYSLTSAFLALVAFFISCGGPSEEESRVAHLPYYSEATFTPQWIAKDTSAIAKFHKIPEFELFNQHGDTLTEQNFTDKIYVADFFFTFCSGICPKMTNNMKLIQDAFLDDTDVLLLSHSVTPDHDTPQILSEYAEAKGVHAEKWHLATGKRETIYDLGRNAYFVEEDLGIEKEPGDFLHTENFVLIDQNRHIRGIYNGLNKTAIAQLITDIKTLKREL